MATQLSPSQTREQVNISKRGVEDNAASANALVAAVNELVGTGIKGQTGLALIRKAESIRADILSGNAVTEEFLQVINENANNQEAAAEASARSIDNLEFPGRIA